MDVCAPAGQATRWQGTFGADPYVAHSGQAASLAAYTVWGSPTTLTVSYGCGKVRSRDCSTGQHRARTLWFNQHPSGFAMISTDVFV